MNLFKNADRSWIPLLHSLAYEETLLTFLENIREESFQPKYQDIFRVFEMPVNKIKLVILGESPYPFPEMNTGLAYATEENSEGSEVLSNIKLKIIESESLSPLNKSNSSWATLSHWEEQGVFLLNASLTTATGENNSHEKMWKHFTEKVVEFISVNNPCIWMLWGKILQEYSKKIKNPFKVEGYNKETIEEIPIDPLLNYILAGVKPAIYEEVFNEEGFYYTNRILDKKSLIKISW